MQPVTTSTNYNVNVHHHLRHAHNKKQKYKHFLLIKLWILGGLVERGLNTERGKISHQRSNVKFWTWRWRMGRGHGPITHPNSCILLSLLHKYPTVHTRIVQGICMSTTQILAAWTFWVWHEKNLANNVSAGVWPLILASCIHTRQLTSCLTIIIRHGQKLIIWPYAPSGHQTMIIFFACIAEIRITIIDKLFFKYLFSQGNLYFIILIYKNKTNCKMEFFYIYT